MATKIAAYQTIARAVSAYADQRRTDAVKLIGTALVGTDARINVNDEDFYGSVRWNKALGNLNYGTASAGTTEINYASETNTEGKTTDFSTDILEFIKTYRTFGVDQYNVTQLITGQPGAIVTVGGQLADVRARDEDEALRSVIEGVIKAEVAIGEAETNQGGQSATNTFDDGKGFYVDLGTTKLVDTTKVGAKAVEGLLSAISYAFADQEDDFMYLLIDQAVMLDLRLANFIDDDRVTEGNIDFQTILNGKIRLILSRKGFAAESSSSAVTGVKTSVLMKAGAVSFNTIGVSNPVAFDRDESVGGGSGLQEMWARWSYCLAPRGYTWAGLKTAYATNALFKVAASWTRKETIGNLGILPIFHA